MRSSIRFGSGGRRSWKKSVPSLISTVLTDRGPGFGAEGVSGFFPFSIGITHCPLLSICRVGEGASKTTLARENPGCKGSRISAFRRPFRLRGKPAVLHESRLVELDLVPTQREALNRKILAQGLLQLVLDEPVCLADEDNDRHRQHDCNGSANNQDFFS